MYNAYWDHLKEQLSSTPPDFTCALELIKNVKENRLRNEIEESLDLNLFKQETEQGVLDVLHLSTYILNWMGLLCAPVRDEAVKTLESIKDPADLLRGIFHVLSLMKMDMVNDTVKYLHPYWQEHSIQHERAKFQKLLDKQPDFLICTKIWLTDAARDLTTPFPSSDVPRPSTSMTWSFSDQEVENSEPPSLTMVLYQAYLNLLLKDYGNEEFPETLLMDRIRLQKMNSKLKHLTVLASVLLVARSFTGSVLFRSPEFLEKLRCITKTLTQEFNSKPEETMLRVSEQVPQEINQGLKDKGLAALSSESKASLVSQLQNIAKKENCIRIIIEQRIRLFFKCCLVRGMRESLLDFPGGLLFIEGELAELGWKFVSLIHYNQDVFSPYYAEILKDIISPAQPNKTEVEPI
ncbi:T-complex protein 11 homolog isoform X1 [Perognathus longimembris pacificus]|uniref:T-complex protein 11 homolog isoform X1 n=1 Tax=Perognathus longimembris pacificus TaxID=214514 RepID=UPI0020189E7A|nr:T-complex protein 11 homolog isoform X1 [Perognathus longimembris pacificus]